MSTSETVDALYAPRRTVLDPILVDAARAAGAMIRFQTGLVDLVRDDRGQVTGAVLKGPSGPTYTVAAERVIGADGAGSMVPRLAGAPFDERMTHATAVVYGNWSGLENDGYHWHYCPSTSVGVIPTTGGETCVFAAMPPARLTGGASPELYHEVLAECAPGLRDRLAGARLEGRLTAFAGRPGFLRRTHGPGLALVGDAGYFKDPITAHGLTNALQDAELLANAVATGTEAALAYYRTLRDAFSLPLLEVTDEIAAFDWDLDRLQALHPGNRRRGRAPPAHLDPGRRALHGDDGRRQPAALRRKAGQSLTLRRADRPERGHLGHPRCAGCRGLARCRHGLPGWRMAFHQGRADRRDDLRPGTDHQPARRQADLHRRSAPWRPRC